jgi:hypothetical protein
MPYVASWLKNWQTMTNNDSPSITAVRNRPLFEDYLFVVIDLFPSNGFAET